MSAQPQENVHMLIPEAIRYNLKTLFLGTCETLAKQPPDAAQIEKTAQLYGHYIPHALDETIVRSLLFGAAVGSGLTAQQAQMAVDAGLATGMADPKAPPVDFLGEQDIQDSLKRKLLNREADKRVAAIVAAENPAPPFSIGLLKDLDPTPVQWHIEGLLQQGARVTQVAQRKAGKTTLSLNLARSLTTGQDFLGRFAVNPLSGNVAWLNYELSEAQARDWARSVGVPEDRLVVVSLRGRRNPFAHEDDLAKLSQLLRGLDTEFLIPDPFSGAYPGANQDSASEVEPWLRQGLDRFLSDTGITGGCLMPVHTGWGGERTRGSSSLEGWPDAMWYMTKDEKTEQRFFRADGRDVDEPENMLMFDKSTRLLSLTKSGSRKHVGEDLSIELLMPVVDDILQRHSNQDPGPNISEVEDTLKLRGVTFTKGHPAKALKRLVERGSAVEKRGPKNAKCYSPNLFLDMLEEEA